MTELTERFQKHLPLLLKWIGVELISVEKSGSKARMTIGGNVENANGVMHGGAIMAFADHVGAITAVVNLPRGANTSTIESKTNFFRPGKMGETITAEAVPLHVGSKTIVVQTRILNSEGKPIAMITQTQIVAMKDA